MSDDGFSVAEKRLLTENKYEFQAEINRLMSILINSLYSNRDIFLREIISNASDALDKIRFLSLTDKSQLGEGQASNLEIRIKVDHEKKILHIRDSGIGMKREDLVNNLGRIAKSGTAEFIEKLADTDSLASQIGQFGVGFYSSFLASNIVTVTTKHNDDVQYIWESSDTEQGSYTISEDPRGNTLGRGTLVSMHLKPDAEEYLEEENLKKLVKEYSEFINFPIYLWNSHLEDIVEENLDETENSTEKEKFDETSENETSQKTTEPKKKTVWEWELINQNKPIWTRKPSEITEAEHLKFYQSLSQDNSEYLEKMHFQAEGDNSFTALFYIPKEPPFSMFDPRIVTSNLRLYVKRVLISDKFELLPKYLAFLVGLVDSDDLPLNISRETLQQHKIIELISKKLVRKAIAMFQELFKNEPEKYDIFYSKYHTSLKLGAIEDFTNRARLMKLMKFSTYRHDTSISFEQYVSEMKEGQKNIYFLGGETLTQIKSSPLLETVIEKGYDVVFLTTPIDEYLLETVSKFEHESQKFKFSDIGKEGLKLDEDEDKNQIKALEETFKPLTEFLKNNLQTKFSQIKISKRLVETPCVIVAAANSYSANMERIVKAQALGSDQRLKHIPPSSKVFELNPHHPIIKELLNLVNNNQIDVAKEMGQLLYDSAIVASGFSLEKPLSFAQLINKVIGQSLNVDLTEFEKSIKESRNNQKEELKEDL